MCVRFVNDTMLDSSAYEIVPAGFFLRSDVVQIAQEMVGLYLFHRTEEGLTGGRIVETEAYCGRNDRACHAFNRRTARTEVMYGSGGTAYIYLCYGVHHLFNVVTNEQGLADAVLVRALEPTHGVDLMKRRTGKQEGRLAAGPGMVGKAMGFHARQSGARLGSAIWIAQDPSAKKLELGVSPRIGVAYAGEDASLPWRFFERGNACVSK